VDTNRAGRTPAPTGEQIRAGDGMLILGAGMKTDTIESGAVETDLGMIIVMAGMTDTTAGGVLTGMVVQETATMDTIAVQAA